MRSAITLLCFSLCLVRAEAQRTVLIHAGRLVDGHSEAARSNVTVVIDDDRITRIEEGFTVPETKDALIDLKQHTVMPGLMDMHTHLIGQHSKKSYSEKFFMHKQEYALRSSMFAKRTLLAGFTTVRELGDDGVNGVALRKAIDEGWIIGPRIFTAGKSLATTGGHADPTNGLRGDWRKDAGR